MSFDVQEDVEMHEGEEGAEVAAAPDVEMSDGGAMELSGAEKGEPEWDNITSDDPGVALLPVVHTS